MTILLSISCTDVWKSACVSYSLPSCFLNCFLSYKDIWLSGTLKEPEKCVPLSTVSLYRDKTEKDETVNIKNLINYLNPALR